jgi:hypothetical protein
LSAPETFAMGSADLVSGAPNTKVPKRETTDQEYKAMMLRLIRRYACRVEVGDLQTLTDLVEVLGVLKLAVDVAVAAQRNHPENPASWAEIASTTGLSRSAAQERWGALGGARRPGGQPGHLR